jgi:hypothetical protein
MNSRKDSGLAVSHDQLVKTNSKPIQDADFATGVEANKAESELCAQLAMAGHAVHRLADGGYLVSKYGYTYHASDLEGIKSFAVRLGECHE